MCTYIGEQLPTLQKIDASTFSVQDVQDGGRKLLRYVGKYTNLHGVIFHKMIMNTAVTNLNLSYGYKSYITNKGTTKERDNIWLKNQR
jgi:hypothetical protein